MWERRVRGLWEEEGRGCGGRVWEEGVCMGEGAIYGTIQGMYACVGVAYLKPCEMKFFSNFWRNSRYRRSSGVSASSPTTAFIACTSLPMA